MSPSRFVLLFLTVAVLLAALTLAACGPALSHQVRLNLLGKLAADDCVAQKRRDKCEKDATSTACAEATVRCRDAQRCVEAVRDSVEETQRVQKLRATVGASSGEETVARLKHDAAVIECQPYAAGGKYTVKPAAPVLVPPSPLLTSVVAPTPSPPPPIAMPTPQPSSVNVSNADTGAR